MSVATISNSPVSVNSQLQAKSKKVKNKGLVAGYLVNSYAPLPVGLASFGIMKGMKKISDLPLNDSVQMFNAADEALRTTGLADKGVKVLLFEQDVNFEDKAKSIAKDVVNIYKALFTGKIDELSEEQLNGFTSKISGLMDFTENDKEALEAMGQEVFSNKKLAKLFKKIENAGADTTPMKEWIAKVNSLVFKTGNNACYLPNANKVIVPDKHLQTSVFHEIGHALNNNGGVALKALQKIRPLATIVPPIVLLISLLNKRKTTDEKLDNSTVKNRIQNVADGVKKHAGTITALSMAPMVVEEAIASLRGQNLAKNLVKDGLLSADTFKKIKLTNLGGFSSYALATIATVAACKLAIKAKDAIQTKYEQKLEEKKAKRMQTK